MGTTVIFASEAASEAANEVTYDAVQILGGQGYMKDHPVEQYYRDALVTEIYEITSEIQRIVIFRSILQSLKPLLNLRARSKALASGRLCNDLLRRHQPA